IIDLIEFVGKFEDTSDDATESTGGFSFSIGTASTVLRNFTTFGLPWATQKYKELTGATDENAKAVMRAARDMKDAVDPIDLWGQALADAAVDADTATEAVDNLASELLALADPVFGAVDALDKLQTELRQADEDGERTAEEMLNITKATLEAQAAFDAVNADNIQGAADAMAAALDIPITQAMLLLEQLGIIDGKQVLFTIQGRWNIPPAPIPGIRGGVLEGIGFGGLQAGFHGGGIVGGTEGTKEVLAVLEKGEGVIDRDTMSRGITGGGTVVNVVVEGSVVTERALAVNVARQLERLRKSGATI
ncbi:hypothetical protein LCGC14_3137480, partial [marine sediment metagenome]